jgi:RHS repeat-associated protein
VPADASPIADFSYLYTTDGQRDQETLSGGGLTTQTSVYAFDNVGRLEQVTLPTGTCRRYSYDLDSNRTLVQEATSGCAGTFATTASYLYDQTGTASPGVDELTTVTQAGVTTPYSHTGDGQVASRGSDTFSWDGWGRSSGGTFNGTTVSYVYDAEGGLRQRTGAGGDIRRYLLGGLLEADNVGTLTTTYVDGPVGDLASYPGSPASAGPADYLYYNGHGDLAAEADASGTRTALHTYDPFGAPLDAPPVNVTSHRYTGAWDKQYDQTNGLILMGARPYDPTIGRFLAVDPIDGGSLNNYDYANQDPINEYDLSGEFPCPGCHWLKKHAEKAVKFVAKHKTQIAIGVGAAIVIAVAPEVTPAVADAVLSTRVGAAAYVAAVGASRVASSATDAEERLAPPGSSATQTWAARSYGAAQALFGNVVPPSIMQIRAFLKQPVHGSGSWPGFWP